MSDLPIFEQIRSRGQIFPFPDEGRLVEENPPCLSWLPLKSKPRYTVVLNEEGVISKIFVSSVTYDMLKAAVDEAFGN